MPECTIAPLQGAPNLEYLTELNTYLNSCSASVHSNIGCGTLVHLALTAPPAVYTLLSATAFVVPMNPGPTVTIPTPAPASTVIGSLTREHTEKLRTWKTYTDTDKACKQKLLGLVPEVYYHTLKKKYTAYAGITCLTLLTHLHSDYRSLTSQDIDDIDKRMKISITGETELETFVQHIEYGQEAVALQNPYTDTQIVTIAENLIESAGLYTMDCREWNRMDTTQKTWVNFKVYFSRAFREHRYQYKQAQSIGYGHASTQNSANAAMFAEMTQDQSHALTNLATATQSDHTTVANMSQKITDIPLQLRQANAKLAEAHSSISTLTSKLSQT